MMKAKPKPFLIRRGEAFCRGCDTWKVLDDFYDDRTAKAPYHGKRLRCKECEKSRVRMAYLRNHEQHRAKLRERKRKAHQLARKADRTLIKRASLKRTLVVMTDDMYDLLIGHLEYLQQRHEELQNVAFVCRMAERQVWSVMHRQRGQLDLETIERILIAADAESDLEHFMPMPGIDEWSKKGHRHCQDCGSWDHPHCAKGLCERCYVYQSRNPGRLRSESGDMRRGAPKYWAHTAQAMECVICNRSNVRHHSGGWCEACYQRAEKRRQRMEIPREQADMRKIVDLPFRCDVTKLNKVDFMK